MNAIFFDMDGTLIDSRADLATAVNETRRALRLESLSQEAVLAHVGHGARALLEGSIPECAGRFEEIADLFRAQYEKHLLDETQLYPRVRTTLFELQDRGWLLGINTNKPHAAVHMILEHFGLLRLFGQAIVAGGDCPQMKPSGEPLRLAASRLKGHRLSAHDWMVGDHWTDMASGQDVGLKTAFCSYGFGQLKDARYTIKIRNLDELLRYCPSEE